MIKELAKLIIIVNLLFLYDGAEVMRFLLFA